MALFDGPKRELEALRTEHGRLQTWAEGAVSEIARLNLIINQLNGQIRTLQEVGGGDVLRAEQARLQAEAQRESALRDLGAARIELTGLGEQIKAARAQVVDLNDAVLLQEVGIYNYRHTLDTALSYKQRLDDLRGQIKQMVKDDQAVLAATNWVVGGSEAQGRKMVKDLKKLMLRAYNAEADTIVRTLRPYAVARGIERLSNTRLAIMKLGAVMDLRLTATYHELRRTELELVADYLMKLEEEKEAARAMREAEREEAKARREFEVAEAKLQRQRAQYEEARARALINHDESALAQLDDRLAEIDRDITDVERRAANTRAGYVYVISNLGAFGEQMVKIGMTRRLDPMDRVRELGDASVPFRFDVHALIFSEDAVGLETRLHQALADRRVNRVNMRREFFYATPHEVREVLASFASSDLLLQFDELAEALEFRASREAAA